MPKGSKVEWYATGSIDMQVAFPNGEISCRYCPFVRDEARGLRYRCTVTQEVLYAPDKDTGVYCPLHIEYPEGHKPQTPDTD